MVGCAVTLHNLILVADALSAKRKVLVDKRNVKSEDIFPRIAVVHQEFHSMIGQFYRK